MEGAPFLAYGPIFPLRISHFSQTCMLYVYFLKQLLYTFLKIMALDNTKIKSKTTLDAVLVLNKLGENN